MSYKKKQRIVLIAMDHSERSRNILLWYMKNIRQDEDKVVVVNAVNHDDLFSPPNYQFVAYPHEGNTFNSLMDYAHVRIKDHLSYFTNILLRYKVQGTVRSIHSSSVGKGIVHTASEIGADIVILGSKGHSKLRRTLFGSTSHYVMNKAQIPVIVCKQHKGCTESITNKCV